jgi:tRNA A37 threonylcarbamoyladenosine dehydratase
MVRGYKLRVRGYASEVGDGHVKSMAQRAKGIAKKCKIKNARCKVKYEKWNDGRME